VEDDLTDIGHAQLMFDRLQRLHESMRARGASPSAMARLPRLPRYDKPIELPPIVLAKREASPSRYWEGKPRMRASGRFASPDQVAAGAAISQLSPNEESDITQRSRAIVGMVAKAFDLYPYQVLEGSRIRRFGPARKVAALMLRTVQGIGYLRVSRAFGLRDTGASSYLIAEGRRLVQSNPDVASRHDAALAAIKKRWPEYRT
jgi:hypothetical protein